LLALVLVAGGCQCDTPPALDGARGGFEAQEAELDFGRVLEGQKVRRAVTVLSTGRAQTAVTASTEGDGLFLAAASEVEVSGGGTAPLEVVFTAGNGPAQGRLVLAGGGHTVTVVLRGLGVRPLACVPSGPCRESRFDLESGTCVESPAGDNAPCTPESRCMENGRCLGGVCLGSPRRCDDDNPCTTDACNPERGCVTAPVACPQPSNPCKVGVCKRETGCGEADAVDLTPCGSVDCKTADVCISGTCKSIPTPEGTLCAPATLCQGEGRCTGGECMRPDAGELEPTFSQELGGEPVTEPGGPVLLSQGSALYTSVCGGDGGCRLVSFTSSGLLRYEAPWPDGGARALLAASDGGVVVHEPGALEAYAPQGPGARLWRAPLEALAPEGTQGLSPAMGPGRVALTPSGEVMALVSWGDLGGGGTGTLAVLGGAEDGGVRAVRSGTLEGFGGDARLALDGQGQAFAFAADGPLVRADAEDGGLRLTRLRERVEGGNASLAVSGGWTFAGTRAFVDTQGTDGGTVDWGTGLSPLASPVLLLDGVGHAFARVCSRPDGLPCTPGEERLLLRALDARSGATRWETPVLPYDAPGALHEAALLKGGLVGTVIENTLPTGTRSFVQLLARQGALAVCPLRGEPRVAGALFSGEQVYVVLQRDGAWWLEAFGLGPGVSVEPRGAGR
jgi:hypothetical protein